MADNTAIAWADATWNPVTGCDPVSPGCDRCYAKTIPTRFAGTKAWPNGFKVTLRPERMATPYHWRRPRRIFVCSTSDLFHADVPDGFIADVMAAAVNNQRHNFLILTKRHARMRALFASEKFRRSVYGASAAQWADLELLRRKGQFAAFNPDTLTWPLPNVWAGVTAEDQKSADIRVPALLETPAALLFASVEPMLGPVSLPPGLDWVICGGESQSGARPMEREWVDRLAGECAAARVPLFVKQLGAALARELGVPGKGDDPALWPYQWPQQFPQPLVERRTPNVAGSYRGPVPL